jgi:hypothetical protein
MRVQEFYEAPVEKFGPGGVLVDSYRAVFVRIREDLSGIWVTKTDHEFMPAEDFYKAHPDATVIPWHGDVVKTPSDPTAMNLERLADFVLRTDSLDMIVAMKKKDPRKGAVAIYDTRLQQLLGIGEEEEEPEEEEEGAE